MTCNRTPHKGVPRYLNNCNCDGVLDELLQSEAEYVTEGNRSGERDCNGERSGERDCSRDCECGEEYRPACDIDRWRVAMTYVPIQSWEESYSPSKALRRGTIFPGLDLPFRGGGGR